jgi:hypothetical protein
VVLRRLERVRRAIGCQDVGGAGMLVTLGDGASAGGAGIGVGATITLGGDAGVVTFTLGGGAVTGTWGAVIGTWGAVIGTWGAVIGTWGAVIGTWGCMSTLGGDTWAFANCKLGGPPSGMLKMARRLSTASSWAWQLSCDFSALIAMVRARRQWMILSLVLNVGTDNVGCWKVTVSETMSAADAVLMTE